MRNPIGLPTGFGANFRPEFNRIGQYAGPIRINEFQSYWHQFRKNDWKKQNYIFGLWMVNFDIEKYCIQLIYKRAMSRILFCFGWSHFFRLLQSLGMHWIFQIAWFPWHWKTLYPNDLQTGTGSRSDLLWLKPVFPSTPQCDCALNISKIVFPFTASVYIIRNIQSRPCVVTPYAAF